jgi:DNA gyrase/topoisomerase IV subunit B
MDDDLFSLLKRYVYEASMITGLPVTLNEKKIVVKDLSKYVRLFYPSVKDHCMMSFKAPNGDECVLIEKGITDKDTDDDISQVSWINGINTRDGGIHVEAWKAALLPAFVKVFNARKPKKGEKEVLKATAKEIYPYLTLFVRAEAEGAMFNGQTKDMFTELPGNVTEVTLAADKKQKLDFSKSIAESLKKILKWNFVSLLEEKLAMKAERTQAKKETTGKKRMAFGDKAEDANFAGTKRSEECTLWVTEGKSAKTFAMRIISGLPNGTDLNGILALRGKFINSINNSLKDIRANKEVEIFRDIMRLMTGADYNDPEMRKTLRYGRIVIACDQDDDGFHIKGLFLLFLWKFWPSLFDLTTIDGTCFVCSISTAVVMARSGKGKNETIKMFYSNPEFKSWYDAGGLAQMKNAKIKYYKGLGTHLPGDEKLYNNDPKRIQYVLDGEEPDYMDLGFNKVQSNWRKTWITRDLVKPGEMSIVDETLPITIDGELSLSTFVDTQLKIYHIMALRRALPNIYDGFKESQRKAFYGIMNDKDAKKDAQNLENLAGAVKKATGYHHGGDSLENAIKKMAQGFVGTNNIPLLTNEGEFGCVDPETDILMWDGYIKKAKDVVEGDVLVGDDGEPRNVLKTIKGVDKMYDVIQRYGETYRINSHHILTLRYFGHKKIYWKETDKSWSMEYFDDENKKLRHKKVKTKESTKGNHFNASKLTKEQAYKVISDFSNTIPDENVFDIELQTFLSLPKSVRESFHGFTSSATIKWEKTEVSIDPYILGMWLGDGSQQGRGFASADPELVKEWVIWTNTIGVEVVHYANQNGHEGYQYGLRRRGTNMNNRNKDITPIGSRDHTSETCIGCLTSQKKHPVCNWIYEEKDETSSKAYDYSNINGVTRDDFNPFKILLREYNLVKNKHIPDSYIFNDEETRLKLLAGFIDTDGCLKGKGEGGQVFEISQEETSHGHMIDSLQFIARSLGFKASVGTYISKRPNGNQSSMKTLRISGDLHRIPTKLPRKQATKVEHRFDSLGGWIDIQEVGKGKFVGWELDGNERFLFGDFTVTHNTRASGGSDAAAARYISTKLEDISWAIFSEMDEPILRHALEEDKEVEYEQFMPVICIILINGAEGIASGFSTTIPCHNPKDISDYQKAKLKAKGGKIDFPPLVPWYRGYKGKIELVKRVGKEYKVCEAEEKATSWRTKGILEKKTGGWWRISELPVGMWTETMKEYLEYLYTGQPPKGSKKKKTDRYLTDIRWKGTANTAVWDIKPVKDFIPDMEVVGNFKNMQNVFSLTNMHVIDENNYPRKYSRAEDLLDDFYVKRLEFYEKRKSYWTREYQKQFDKESDRYKYVQAVIEGKLAMKQEDSKLEAAMLKLGLRKAADAKGKTSFDYLLSMQMRSIMSANKLEEIKKEVEKIKTLLNHMKNNSAEELWLEDLEKFDIAYEKFLKTRREE